MGDDEMAPTALAVVDATLLATPAPPAAPDDANDSDGDDDDEDEANYERVLARVADLGPTRPIPGADFIRAANRVEGHILHDSCPQ